jgi:hypothetical protein
MQVAQIVNDEMFDVVSGLTRDIGICKSFRIVNDEVIDVVSRLTSVGLWRVSPDKRHIQSRIAGEQTGTVTMFLI